MSLSTAGQVQFGKRGRAWTALICLILFTAMLAGCDGAGGPTDLSDQLTGFVQDFARGALAAWLL